MSSSRCSTTIGGSICAGCALTTLTPLVYPARVRKALRASEDERRTRRSVVRTSDARTGEAGYGRNAYGTGWRAHFGP